MYFASQTVLASRVAALDHCQQASDLMLDSAAQLVELYFEAGRRALGAVGSGTPLPGVCKEIAERHVPDFLMSHLRIAGHANEGWVHLIGAQLHMGGSLARFALGKSAQMAPPMIELALDATKSIVVAGEAAADELGDASLKAIDAIEKKLERPAPRGRSNARRAGGTLG